MRTREQPLHRIALSLALVTSILLVGFGLLRHRDVGGTVPLSEDAEAVLPLVVCESCGVPAPPPEAATCAGLPLPPGLQPGSSPAYEPGSKYAAQVAGAIEAYRRLEISYADGIAPYDPVGGFLDFGLNNRYESDPAVHWDSAGIPLIEYDDLWYRNPVTVSQYALTLYARHLQGQTDEQPFLYVVRELLTMQDSRGAFPAAYPFTYYLTGEVLQPGWVSGMTQGQVLSVLRRAYALTGDQDLLSAGDLALDYLRTPREQGGPMDTLAHLDPELGEFMTFEEFPTVDPYYTLNGFLYTLLGVYDWSTIERNDGGGAARLASQLFECGLATTLYTLPYYDVGGFSAYDLGHVLEGVRPNIQVEYHAIHLHLLYALNSIQPWPELEYWLTRWADAVDAP